jgi:hypothetical protein
MGVNAGRCGNELGVLGTVSFNEPGNYLFGNRASEFFELLAIDDRTID